MGRFEVDPWTLGVTGTNGFCGLGTDDWYAHQVFRRRYADPQPAIHPHSLARLGTAMRGR